jgi:hypothetical protein
MVHNCYDIEASSTAVQEYEIISDSQAENGFVLMISDWTGYQIIRWRRFWM